MMIRRLQQLDSSAVSDALDAKGLRYQVPHGIHPLFPTRRVTGKVVMVQLVSAQDVQTGHHLGTAAIKNLRWNDVVVVANAARTDAEIGRVFAPATLSARSWAHNMSGLTRG